MRSKDENIAKLIEIISKRYLSTKEIARILNVSQRSVQRYIKELKEKGYNILKKGNKYRLGEEILRTEKFLITKKEIEILKDIEKILEKFGYSFIEEYKDIVKKIKRITWEESFLLSPFPHFISFKKEIYDKIKSAIEERKKIEILYKKPNLKRKKKTKVSPIFLFSETEGFYLLAIEDKTKEFRTFKLSRIEDVSILPDIMPLEYIELLRKKKELIFDMWGPWKGERNYRVKLKVRKYARAVFKELNHPGITFLEKKRNYDIIEVKISDIQGFLRWILKFVDEVEIIEPEGVKRKFKKFLKRLIRLYKIV